MFVGVESIETKTSEIEPFGTAAAGATVEPRERANFARFDRSMLDDQLGASKQLKTR